MTTLARIPCKPFWLALAASAGALLQAGGGDIHVSNQSSKGAITLTLCDESAAKADVLISFLDRPAGAGSRALAPTLLKPSASSWTLKPGQTAVITLKEPPGPDQAPAVRSFRATQEGQAGAFTFTCTVSLDKGQPRGEVEADGEGDAEADLEKVDPDILVFWGFCQPKA